MKENNEMLYKVDEILKLNEKYNIILDNIIDWIVEEKDLAIDELERMRKEGELKQTPYIYETLRIDLMNEFRDKIRDITKEVKL